MAASSEPPDFELLRRWRDGDLAAGDRLFDRHFAAVHRFFRNKVGDGIEDLVQQTFMACVEGKTRFREQASFRTYLFGAAHNLLREHYRTRRRDADAIELDASQSSAADTGLGPTSFVGQRREQRLLLEALRRIPIDFQIVLELYYWEDMSASQAADVLGLPEGTVRGRLRAAKQRLKQQLGRLALTREELDSTVGGLERWAAGLRDDLGRAES